MADDTEYEVVRSVAGGWGVRRKGEAQVLSYHDEREQAEEAARLHSSGGAEVDVRQDVSAEAPDQEVDAKRTFGLVALLGIGVFLLIVVVAVFLVLTGITV